MTNRLIEELLGERHFDVPRLSAKEAAILRLLTCPRREMYGLQLVAESAGEIGRGTVYVTLSRMQEKGYVESRQEMQVHGAIGLPRRLYSVTPSGAVALRAWECAANALLRVTGAA
jgi:DNA-binding PadR family transcriptional regulator